MVRLISEYSFKARSGQLHTTQDFKTVEDALHFVETRPDNKKYGIERYFGEYTVHGKCDLLMTVETDDYVKNYYVFE